MRSYFIDYCQIWIPPSNSDWDEVELLKVQNNINRNLFGNDKTKGNCKCLVGMQLTLFKRFFDSCDFNKNIKQIFDAVKTVNALHSKYWNFDQSKPSRIDFGCNLPFYLNTHNYSLSSCADHNVIRYYNGCESEQNLTGLKMGEKGRDGVQLFVSDERYYMDKTINKSIDLNNYTKLVYKVGSEIFRRRLAIPLLKDLRKYEIHPYKDIIDSLRKLKDLSFDDEDKYIDRNYTDADFKKAVGIEVDSPDQEQIIEEIPIGDCQ